MSKKEIVNIGNQDADTKFFKALNSVVAKELRENSYSEIVIICIGTDRATGDSLGPLVGHYISKLIDGQARVYGTLDSPVHAKNLDQILEYIRCTHANPLIVAIDASLGKTSHIGNINIIKGSIEPGSGVGKTLQSVGTISITGVVNFSGYMDMLILQNTRLSTVMKMAEIISDGILKLLSYKVHGQVEFAICKEAN